MITNSNKGFALYLVLLIIVSGSIFSTVLFNGFLTNIKLSKNISGYQKAFYSADAGITFARFIIKNAKGLPQKNSSGQKYIPGKIFEEKSLYGNSNFKVRFNKIENKEKLYMVNVDGKYENISCKIRATIDVNGVIKEYRIMN